MEMEFGPPPEDDDELLEPPPSAQSDYSEGSDIPFSGDEDGEEYDEDEEEYEFEDELDEELEGQTDRQTAPGEEGGTGGETEVPSSTVNGEPTNDNARPNRGKRMKAKADSDSSTAVAVKKRRKGKGPAAKVKKKRSSKSKQLRRDIKTLIKETELEAGTLAAQREEEERKRRLEEQRAQNASPPALLTQLLETNTSELLAEQRRRNIADTNEYILLDSSSGDEEKKKSTPSASQERKGSTECIEILSSDEEEEVKVISGSERESEAEFGPDQETSGTHTDDRLNQPDLQGRVLVNVAHPLDEPDIYLPSHLAGRVKPHQIGGIRFLYDNLVENIRQFRSSIGFGCILAHSMGLGKTLQVITFTDIFLRYTSAKSVLIIVPINTLQNWIAEFEMWLPSQGDESSGWQGRKFSIYVLNDTHKTTMARAKVISDWYQSGGVMLMGYEIYRLLCNRRMTGKPRRRKKKASAGPEVIDLEEEERIEKELDDIRHAICDPGPDLVVCDEGHRIKNSLAGISKALKNIKTRRRVVLTGYPLQNNLMEYWCMVDFVRPNYLGTKHEFSNLFERPITNGQCLDSTPADVRLMKYRAHVLHNKLAGFVQRRGFKVLKVSLPQKHEHVILVRLTQFQKGLYCKFMQCFKDAGAGGWCSTNPLKAFAVGCKIWNHPDILYDVLQERETDVDKDLDIPELASKNGPRKQPKSRLGSRTASAAASPTPSMDDIPRTNGVTSFEEKLENMSYQEKVNQILSFEWARDNMRNYTQSKVSNGGKMVLLFHIIDESIKVGDKVLVFSQSLMTLSLIEKFLSLRKIPDPPDKDPEMCQNWIRNISYYRLDGSTASSERERMINQFNKPSNNAAWLFLLSTRAGCLGVNLIGANRVVVLDASWNPCHDAQAVCRVYRYGQQKTCHIYRMVTDNTLEKKIYDRQISKKGMSDRVVDELNPQMNLTKKEVESLLEFDDSDMPFEDFGHMADEFEDHILQKICSEHSQMICKAPFSTESLLWDRKDQRLTSAEKAIARKTYEEELRMNSSYNRPSYAAYYPKPDKYLGSAGMPMSSGGYEGSLPYLLNMRGQIQMPKRPVASVRPLQSTPLPKYPPGAGLGLPKPPPAPSSLDALKGLSVQRIVATTDILLPNANTLTNTTTKISAGETVTFIKTPRGIYLRTPEGRFIAVRGPNSKNTNQLDGQGQSSKETVTIDSDGDSPRKGDQRNRDFPSSSSHGGLVNSLTSPLLSIPGYPNPLTQGMGPNLGSSAISTSSSNSVGGQLPPLGLPPFMYRHGFPGVSITTPTGNFFHQQPAPGSNLFGGTSASSGVSQMPTTIDLTSMFPAEGDASNPLGLPGSSGVLQGEGSRLPATTQITASSSSDGVLSMDITQLPGGLRAETGLPQGNPAPGENGSSPGDPAPQGNSLPSFDMLGQGSSLPQNSGLTQVDSFLQGSSPSQGGSLPLGDSLPRGNNLLQGTIPPLQDILPLADNSTQVTGSVPPLSDVLRQGTSLNPGDDPTSSKAIPGVPSLNPGTSSLPPSTVMQPFLPPKPLAGMAPGLAGVTSPFQKPLQGLAPGSVGRERLPFLSVPPQLPTLDANSVEEILNSTSSEGDSDPKEVTASDVQSSNLASLSQFVSSSFPSSLSQM